MLSEVTSKSVQWFSGYKRRKRKRTICQTSEKLQIYYIIFVMLLNQQTDRQESIVISHLKSNTYRNKSLTKLYFDIGH